MASVAAHVSSYSSRTAFSESPGPNRKFSLQSAVGSKGAWRWSTMSIQLRSTRSRCLISLLEKV
jgi:hypothetical protein